MTKDSLQQNSETVSENEFSQCDPHLKASPSEMNQYTSQLSFWIKFSLKIFFYIYSLFLNARKHCCSGHTVVWQAAVWDSPEALRIMSVFTLVSCISDKRKEYNKWENQRFDLIYLDLNTCVLLVSLSLSAGDKDGSKVTTVVATPGQGPDRPQEVSYTDTKVIGNGSFGVVYQAKLCDSGELVAIKKVLQDKRFKVKLVMTENSCRHKWRVRI